MTIRSTIGTAEVSLEATEVRTAMSDSLLLRYDVEALLLAVGEVLRGIGPEYLSETADRVLTLIDGEDLTEDAGQDVLQALAAVDGQAGEYRPADWPTVARTLAYEVRRLRGLPQPEESARPWEEQGGDGSAWSPPAAGATGDPRQ